MSMELEAVIDTPDYSVDMKSGLDTLQGVSDATCIITEAVLTRRVREKQTKARKVRTKLKKTFKGSFGHSFSIELYDDELKDRLADIGKETFSEIISFFLCEALYKETPKLSNQAKKVIDNLEETAEKIVEKLRKTTLKKIHQVSNSFDHDIKVRFCKNKANKTVLARFNQKTAESLKVSTSNIEEDLHVIITRFNIFTGNGRMVIKGHEETVAFGFKENYKLVSAILKKSITVNLNQNNGKDDEKDWSFLKIAAYPIQQRDGTTLKHLIKGIY